MVSHLFCWSPFSPSSLIPSSPNLWFFVGSLPRPKLCSVSIPSSYSPHFSKYLGFHLHFLGINSVFSSAKAYVFFQISFKVFSFLGFSLLRTDQRVAAADLSSLDYKMVPLSPISLSLSLILLLSMDYSLIP